MAAIYGVGGPTPRSDVWALLTSAKANREAAELAELRALLDDIESIAGGGRAALGKIRARISDFRDNGAKGEHEVVADFLDKIARGDPVLVLARLDLDHQDGEGHQSITVDLGLPDPTFAILERGRVCAIDFPFPFRGRVCFEVAETGEIAVPPGESPTQSLPARLREISAPCVSPAYGLHPHFVRDHEGMQTLTYMVISAAPA